MGDWQTPNGEKEVISTDMGLMVGDISIPLIPSSFQLEGIKEEASVGLGFLTLQKLDMLWSLDVHSPSKSTLIPSSLS